MVGRTLSHYRILEKIGSGGMGEVYLAEDTKLSRKVALKILPPEMATGERRMRFEREAKAVAALDHPNIVTIYSVEESDGVPFYTMQLVKGKTLSELIPKKGLPLNKFFEIAIPLADAVSAAHEQGIIHRDLKPANVLLTAKGGVKVLDFGIAKNTTLDANVGATAQATNLTTNGTLMGTPPYMSPEQIRGEEADKRADIWSFGCVLYEALTGKRAFDRETVADTLAAIIERHPDYDTLPPDVPPSIRQLVRRCLEKDQRDRLRDIGDARIEIKQALAMPRANDTYRKTNEPTGMEPEAVGDLPDYTLGGLITAAAGIGLGTFLYFTESESLSSLYLVGLVPLRSAWCSFSTALSWHRDPQLVRGVEGAGADGGSDGR